MSIRVSVFLYGIIVKCYQGIVIGRYDYAGSTGRERILI